MGGGGLWGNSRGGFKLGQSFPVFGDQFVNLLEFGEAKVAKCSGPGADSECQKNQDNFDQYGCGKGS